MTVSYFLLRFNFSWDSKIGKTLHTIIHKLEYKINIKNEYTLVPVGGISNSANPNAEIWIYPRPTKILPIIIGLVALITAVFGAWGWRYFIHLESVKKFDIIVNSNNPEMLQAYQEWQGENTGFLGVGEVSEILSKIMVYALIALAIYALFLLLNFVKVFKGIK